MKRLAVVAVGVSLWTLVGCDRMPTAPTPVAPAAAVSGGATISPAVIAAISGTWAGPTTSSTPAGNGHLVFVFGPSIGSVSAAVTWTSSNTSVSYTGSVAGTMDNLTLSTTAQQTCSYTGKGAINAAGTELTGSYAAAGTGCHADTGTFVLTKQ